jgi:hypothetical protein
MAEERIGLNGQEATAALTKIEWAYDKTMAEIIDAMQARVIGIISGTWFGNDAIEFMRDKFKPAIDEAIKQIETIFQSINDTITQNAQNYDAEHRTSVFQKVLHKVKANTLSIDAMRADLNSFIGITNSSEFESAKVMIDGISDAIQDALQEAVAAAGNSGFYGGGQQDALVSSMQKIKSSLSTLSEELAIATKEKLAQTKAREAEIAAANASTFGN